MADTQKAQLANVATLWSAGESCLVHTQARYHGPAEAGPSESRGKVCGPGSLVNIRYIIGRKLKTQPDRISDIPLSFTACPAFWLIRPTR